MVQALHVGRTYKIKGAERIIGKKQYIDEPIATLVPETKSHRRYKIIIPVAMAMVLLASGASALVFGSSNSATTGASRPTKVAPIMGADTTSPAPIVVSPTESVAATPVPAPSKATTKTTKKAAAPAAVLSPTTAPTSQATAATQPAEQPVGSTETFVEPTPTPATEEPAPVDQGL